MMDTEEKLDKKANETNETNEIKEESDKRKGKGRR